ncbi:MAG: polyphosphate kinase 1 [Planctomycetota bacterium]|nr:polyphosphate kinase 1 [Planctomycetota bacterium]MDA1114790.1 polyphosphate kinase 1 [Planctomycetota bacterium]
MGKKTSSDANPSAKLDRPELFLNRELSLLEFQRRVLAQAVDDRLPLLERLRFLTICSSNLDEFFEIRVAGLKEQVKFGLDKPGVDGRTPHEALADIASLTHDLVEEQYRVLNEQVLPGLRQEGIRLLRRSDWTVEQRIWVKEYFHTQVLPVLTPVALDPTHPFPQVSNKRINFLVEVHGADAFGRDVSLAVVPVPRSLPRVIPLPVELCEGYRGYLMLSAVVHHNIGVIFPGLRVDGCHQFRVTRNSDFHLDEEEVDNVLNALKSQLSDRHFSYPVRLEVTSGCPPHVAAFLLDRFGMLEEELYRVKGPVNLHRLGALYERVDRPDLKEMPFLPGVPQELSEDEDLFAAIRRKDHLLMHPYQSFGPLLELLGQAARDPNVLAIKQTLYRTGENSPVVAQLAKAARAGKEVTVVIELRARFDEAENIELANTLHKAGANVLYGIVGYKTHSKMLLIVRRESGVLRRYVHLGTGNYHPGNAKGYTDLSLFTSDEGLALDVHHVFLQLTGLGRAPQLDGLLVAPNNLYEKLLERIEAEAEAARVGKTASIQVKVNSLSDKGVIQALYKASQAGVQIDLIVRGICRLRPGIEGVSENIRVRSVVGRFLEHTRVFRFHSGGDDLVYAGSADWMERNLHGRVETCFPIRDEVLKQRVIEDVLEAGMADDTDGWELMPDGSYTRVAQVGEAAFNSQDAALAKYAN